jgi:hypothetical protein
VTKITGKPGIMKIGGLSLPVSNLKWSPGEIQDDDSRVEAIWSPQEITITATFNLTEAGRNWLLDLFGMTRDLDDVIEDLETRRWAADYTRPFFKGRPGMRLADCLNVERN